MSLPTVEPILPEDPHSTLPPARRRRKQRTLVPPGLSERASLLNELSSRVIPSIDFFLFSLLSGLVLGLAFLFDSPALVFLAALLAPFMSPVIGASLGTIAGAPRFWLQSLASILIGSLMVFLCTMLAGWAVLFLPESFPMQGIQAALHSRFTWENFIVLALGAGITTYLMVRSPQQKPLVASVAIAYSLYLPIGAAGFGVGSGIEGLWPHGLGLFLIHLVWSILISGLILVILGLRPLNSTGYILGFTYLFIGLSAVVIAQLTWPASARSWGSVLLTPSPSPAAPTLSPTSAVPSATQAAGPTSTTAAPTDTPEPPTATSTPTRTLIPSRTPTLTMSPAPTPVWAKVNAREGNGILVRSEPSFASGVVQSLLNETLVEVLPEVITSEGVTWIKIRTVNGNEGWVVRSLLITATPAPNG
jgi:uncharacterized membrane protein